MPNKKKKNRKKTKFSGGPPEKAGGPPALPKLEELPEATLAELEARHAEPVTVGINSRGKMVKVTGRLLRPNELNPVRLLMERALPPIVPGKNGEEDRYDLRNAEFMAENEGNRRQARALALFAAYPLFQTEEGRAASAEGRKPLCDYIESRNLDDGMLDVLFNRLVRDEKGLQHYVGFI